MNLFVPYEIALKLKEKGFDEPCLGWYWSNGKELSFGFVTSDELISTASITPLYQQVIDWLDFNHHCLIYYLPYLSKAPRRYELFIWYRGNTIKLGLFDSLENGYNKAIEEAIKLI